MIRIALYTGLLLSAVPALAATPAFHPGPVFKTMAPIATIASDLPIPKGSVFKVVFDVTEGAEPGRINAALVTAARFFNVHVEAGVPAKDIHLALVVHGPAGEDLTTAAMFGARHNGAANASAPAIAELLGHDVQIIICGQSAAGRDITKADLLPGVKMSLSAASAHALLQNAGYTLNPF
ncbi:MAG: DsrE family protein [Polymorphobacter sp.]